MSDETSPTAPEIRQRVKRGLKLIEGLRETFAELGAGERVEVAALLASLEDELEGLRPPEPRRCKEYLRALGRAKKGLLGVSPEDVALYCRCPECSELRLKQGLQQPSGPAELEAPPEDEAAAETPVDSAPIEAEAERADRE